MLATNISESGAAFTAVLASTSQDGGTTWSEPVQLSASGVPDKETITADPTDWRYVYAVWDGGGNFASTYFARSIDAGADWQSARPIYSSTVGDSTSVNQIVVSPNGTLLDFFIAGGVTQPAYLAVIRSPDHGNSWTPPTIIGDYDEIGVEDVKAEIGIRTGGTESVAVDMSSGAIYLAWADAIFSGDLRDGIAFSKSVDGGVSWSTPVERA